MTGGQSSKQLSERREQILNPCIVAERSAHMAVTIYVARSEDKAAAQLEGILSQLMLPMATRPRPVAGRLVFAAEHMHQIRVAQTRGAVCLALLVDQQGERNSTVLAKLARVVGVAESYGRQIGSLLAEGLLVCAQLRDVLTAEDSTVVPQENHHGRLALPKRAEADAAAVGIGQDDRRHRVGKAGHGASIPEGAGWGKLSVCDFGTHSWFLLSS